MLTLPTRRNDSTENTVARIHNRVCLLVRGSDPDQIVCKSFAHVEQAEAFIQCRLSDGGRHGFLAFWAREAVALTPQAPGYTPTVMVLLRDREDAEMVRPEFFDDMKAAEDFLRETSELATPFRHASVFFVSLITIDAGKGSIRLSPVNPPEGAFSESGPNADYPLQEAVDRAGADPNQPKGHAKPGAVSEVRKVLDVRRWQQGGNGSFSGFGSPHGRF